MADDRRRLVQQYVERQRSYLPTYTNQDLVNERHRSPPRTDLGFGFGTPVLRPRAPVRQGKSAESPREALSPSKHKTRNKRKKVSTSIDTDSERAARLADRRERKRKKRAIVNPPEKDDDEIMPTTVPKKERIKKPAALALLYGFSATNVTKDRLTLKPAPSLGVFSKGKASAKKKVTATRKSSSRNELFSEFMFLNRPSEQAADPSKVDNDSDGGSTSNHPVPQERHVTNRIKRDRGKLAKDPAFKPSQAPTRAPTESDVWDIEMQSKLPSSARDVSSEPEAKESESAILDLHGAEWSASIDVTEQRKLSVTQSRSRGPSIVRSSPLAGSDLRELCPTHAADVSSLHPSHSASQVERRAADTEAIDLCLVTSKYFTKPEPVGVQELATHPPQTSRWNDGINVLDSQDQDIKEATTIHRMASPMSSPTSVPLPMVEFQTRYDVAPLEFSSDVCAHDDYWGGDVAWEPLDRGYVESSVVEMQDDRFITGTEYDHAHQDETWDWYPTGGLDTEDVEFGGSYTQEYEDGLEEVEYTAEPCFFEAEGGFYMGDLPVYEDEVVDGSICDGEESVNDGADFLEGRALLLGVPGGWSDREEMSGLVQAELDVARRLRDHWLPLRF